MIEYDPTKNYVIKVTDNNNCVCIKDYSPEKLNGLLGAIKKHRHDLRFQQKLSEDVSPHMWRKIKKEIARIKTVQRERILI